MLTSSGGSLNADRGEEGDKICQNLADVICERSLTRVYENAPIKYTLNSLRNKRF